MKTLIVYGHPKTKGHCSLILENIEKELKKEKVEYDVLDLYKIKYDPILHENEHYTAGNREISKENKRFQDMIKKAKRLIFIYPVWWGSMPAIVKGFIDRVFVSGFGFKRKGNMYEGLLKDKKAAVILTTGAPLFFYKLMGSPASKLIKKFILMFCGIKTKVFAIGNANQLTEKQVLKIKKAVRKAIGYLYK